MNVSSAVQETVAMNLLKTNVYRFDLFTYFAIKKNDFKNPMRNVKMLNCPEQSFGAFTRIFRCLCSEQMEESQQCHVQ